MKNKYCPDFVHNKHFSIETLDIAGCTVCDALNRQREDMEKDILDHLLFVFTQIEPNADKDRVVEYIGKLKQSLKGGDTSEVEKEV